MDELTFLREKARRDVQEVLNALDSASAEPNVTKDFFCVLRVVVAGETLREYTERVLKQKELRKEETE